jgi:hypothetical protein
MHRAFRMRLLEFVVGAVMALMFVSPADGACGQVAGVFCNGGECAAGVCQCPMHLVGPNWSVFPFSLSFFDIACVELSTLCHVFVLRNAYDLSHRLPCCNLTSNSEYRCPGPVHAPCSMNGLCYFDPSATPKEVELAANCSCGHAFRVNRPSFGASDQT